MRPLNHHPPRHPSYPSALVASCLLHSRILYPPTPSIVRPTPTEPNRPTDQPTNGRLWLLPLIAARCTLCPIHDSFFIAIKMQLRRFDKARITGALVPLSRLHPPTTLTRPPDIGLDRRDGWNNRWAVIRGKIATFW